MLMKAGLLMATASGLLFSQAAFASAVEQFRQFAAQTKSAKGEFVQQQVRMTNGAPKVTKRSAVILFLRVRVNLSGFIKSLMSKCCRQMATNFFCTIKI
jgi:hypothetical protein